MLNLLRRLWKDEEGQGLAEYGLIIVFVSVAAIVGLGILGGNLDTFFETIAGYFD